MNKIENINLLPDTEPDSGDYTGEDGLLYCGKCRKPKEAYFPEGKTLFGLDRHPAECDCQRAQRIEREAAEQQRRHLDTVEDLKRRGFSDTAMRDWTFENDNGRNPQTAVARFYAEHWDTMQAENIGYLFWGGVGTGKSYLAGCIANALMEQKIPVRMTNFAAILNDLAASFEGRNEYISRLCRYPLLKLSYITHSNSGEGLLFYGNVTIPFVDRFPRGEIYDLLTTRPEDMAHERTNQ